MTRSCCLLLALAAAATLAVGRPRAADEAKPADEFAQVRVGGEELIEDLGLDCFQFELPGVKGTPFELVYRTIESQGAKPTERPIRFTPEAGRTPVLRVTFVRSDREMRGFLLGDHPRAEYRVTAKHCSPSGMATFVDNPLKGTPTGERLRNVFSTPTKGLAGPGESLLLLAARGERDAAKGWKTMTYPRLELVVRRAK